MKKQEEVNKYEAKIVAAIDGLDDNIIRLKKESERIKDNAKHKMDEQIVFLANKKDELQKSLFDIKNNSDHKWDELKQIVDENIVSIDEEARQIFQGVKNGFNHLISKFKKDE